MPVAHVTFPVTTIPALVLATLFAISPVQAQEAAKALPEDAVASVNGRPISQLSVDNVAQQVAAGGQEADKERILDELINLEILTQAAEKMNLDKTADVSAALQLQYTQTMANAYLASKGAEMTFSEDELRAEYDAQSGSVDRAEYRASHILLETQEEADKMITELAAGEAFEELAKANSIDPAGENGGDLGWFQATTMVPEFTEAVAQMEVGETSKTPVESEFGFHVIKLVDLRDAALPDYDSVKSGLKDLAVRKALAKHVEELRAEADIKTD